MDLYIFLGWIISCLIFLYVGIIIGIKDCKRQFNLPKGIDKENVNVVNEVADDGCNLD